MFYVFIFKNIMIFILLLILIVILIVIELYTFFESRNIINVSDSLMLLNDNKAVIIDLRTSTDFQKCHIINSVNVPLNILEKDITLLNKYKNKIVIMIYYNNKLVRKMLHDIGLYNNISIKYFKYGLQEWIDKDMPVIRKC